MVCLEEKPSLRLASCCNREVVKGVGGFFFSWRLSTLIILYSKFSASVFILSASFLSLIPSLAIFYYLFLLVEL